MVQDLSFDVQNTQNTKCVLKLVHENRKSCFFDKNQLLGHIPQTFFDRSPQRYTQSLSLKFGVISTKTKKVMRVKLKPLKLLVASNGLRGQSTLWGWNRLVLGFTDWYGTWYLVLKCGLQSLLKDQGKAGKSGTQKRSNFAPPVAAPWGVSEPP